MPVNQSLLKVSFFFGIRESIFKEKNMKRKEKGLVTVSLRLEEPDRLKLESICKSKKSNKSEFIRNQIVLIIKSLNL